MIIRMIVSPELRVVCENDIPPFLSKFSALFFDVEVFIDRLYEIPVVIDIFFHAFIVKTIFFAEEFPDAAAGQFACDFLGL
jgi:hypothetical protein